ncbi:hypothetical protein N1851_020003 [Merluccius polli]|uniref:Uncharacterized protein n=1 Tax=Merluccius polli TaxID=89951 RepID=A0AA47NYW5_MERPO|nr:hypothetical protein N1851_020003 [Merluccius polli]
MGDRAAWSKMAAMCGRSTPLASNADEASTKTFRLVRLLKAAAPLSGQIRSLYERYRFSSEGIRYLVVLVGPYEGNATKRSRAQCVCVSLRFVATGTYLHTVGDANISAKRCLPIRKVVAALNTLLNMFVVFPNFLPTQTVKLQVINLEVKENTCIRE